MTREQLRDYSPGDGDLGVGALAEANPGGGRRITLREIANTHFMENADQVYSHLLFVNRLLKASGGKFTLSPELLFPLLTNPQPIVQDSINFTLFAEFTKSNSTELGYRFRKALFTELGHPCEVRSLNDDNKTIFKTVFKMKMRNNDETAQKSSDHRKNSYIILEEKSEFIGTTYLSLRLVEDYSKVDQSDSSSSTNETIFSFEIKRQLSFDNDGVLDWTNAGRANWVVDEEEPYVFLTNEALSILSQPMNMRCQYRDTTEETFDEIQSIWKYTLSKPNLDHLNFPIYFPSPDRIKERYIRPYYYLELALLGAKMIKLSVLSNKDVKSFETIAEESKKMFKDEMLMFQNALFMHEFDNKKFDSGSLTYSPIEYLMYELLWQGVDIWPYLDDFTNSMVESFRTNPERFWDTIIGLGFDQVLPFFKGLNKSEKTSFMSDLKPGNDISHLKQVFSLIPSLIPYHDNRPGKEHEQSDEYYMQITLALADYSHQIGQEPVAAIAVHEGKIIGARRNDTRQRDEVHLQRIRIDHKRHAEILLIDSLGDELKPGTKLYVSLVPCELCTYLIRRNENIAEVNCSADSTMRKVWSLTNLYLKEDEHDETITEEPPLVRIGILEDKARELHERTGWTKMPIYHGKGIIVIDNRDQDLLEIAQILGLNVRLRNLIKKKSRDE